MTTKTSIIRRPAVAGQFYPGDPDDLRSMVDGFLAQAARSGPEPAALVSPHAGYVFSGHVAAHAFKQAEGVDYDAIVVLGTDHRPITRGNSIWPEGAYSTPLGDVPIDSELARALMDAEGSIQFRREAHQPEHSIEVQLPFLQRVQPGKKFVPILVSDVSLQNCEALASALAATLKDRKALVVASSDLSHYPDYDDAVRVDRATLAAVVSLDPLALQASTEDSMEEGIPDLHTCMCGTGPVMTTMLYARAIGAEQVDILKYANSGDVAYGDRRGVVGYGAVRFARGSAPGLSAEEKESLLRLVRETLTDYLGKREKPEFPTDSPALLQPRATFVTLRVRETGELRGCRGEIVARQPLVDSVQNMAIASATDDPRFMPVTANEVPRLHIEISALTPMRPIQPEDVVVGRHGLMIIKGHNSGLLLPQVPVEQGWDREEFLRGLCHKAWLPENAWKARDAQLYAFEAEVWGEEEVRGA
jgi:AmmeMemoRadiSam system protein B/AmmeMemoRadiSam system protein A